jgi:hypothetical protein
MRKVMVKSRRSKDEGTRNKNTNYKLMKQYFLEKSILVFMLLATIHSFSTIMAQEVVPAAGGQASGDGGTVSYSIGQLTYQLHSSSGGSVAEGVQLPYEISVVTSSEDAREIKLTVSAFPNPTTDYLTLQVDAFNLSDVSYHLYDMQGKLLQSENISDIQTNVSMRNLVPAVYFIKVMQHSREIKTFKIVKH